MALSAYDKILRAKVQLQQTKPFFSMLVMYLNCKEDNELTETISVDIKGNIRYNSEWIDKQSEKEVEGVLCHEVMHIVLQHLERRGGRDGQLYNIANDMKVNDILVQENMELPKDGVIPDRNHTFTQGNITVTKIDEKTSELIYDELYKTQKKNGKGGGKLPKGFDDHKYTDGNGNNGKDKITKEEMKKLKKKWKQTLSDAAVYAKQIGKLPAGMERLIDDILDSKVGWRHKLYKYITNELICDFTWTRPHKKSMSTGVYMPNVVKEKIQVITHVDTSGSIGQKELSDFLSEIVAITNSFANIEMDLLVCDAKIHDHIVVDKNNVAEVLSTKIKGGGGTSHKPVVEWINKHKPNAKLLITLTDGWSDIEHCFDGLPFNCNRLIVLSENSNSGKNLEDYGEIIDLSR